MSVVVKAYLKKRACGENGPKWEIRRFAIDQDVSTSYAYLIGKLVTIFSGVDQHNARLYWKDSEGDNVTFSSDEELVEALSSMKDGVFKVYIEVLENAKKEDIKHLHEGVVCDGCEGPIYGIRFKCLVCSDYDLCEKCKSGGLHSEHKMREIERSQKSPSPFYFPHFPPPPHANSCHFGEHHRPCKPFGLGFPMGPFHGGPLPEHGPLDGRNMMRKAWKRYWRSLHQDSACKKKCKREGRCSEKGAADLFDVKHCSSSSEEEKWSNHAKNKPMDFMWPLFSLEVGLDHGGRRFHFQKSNKRCQHKGDTNVPGPEQASRTEERSEQTIDGKVNELGKSIEKEGETSRINEPMNESDWTLIRDEDGLENVVRESTEGIKNIQIDEGEDPAIVTSLSQMHSMGFFDDGNGGSLYELMIRVDGDVGKAIEEINKKDEN